jgi:hypothetical protein
MLDTGKLILYLFRYYIRSQQFYPRLLILIYPLETISSGRNKRNAKELFKPGLSNTARVTFVDYKLEL